MFSCWNYPWVTCDIIGFKEVPPWIETQSEFNVHGLCWPRVWSMGWERAISYHLLTPIQLKPRYSRGLITPNYIHCIKPRWNPRIEGGGGGFFSLYLHQQHMSKCVYAKMRCLSDCVRYRYIEKKLSVGKTDELKISLSPLKWVWD